QAIPHGRFAVVHPLIELAAALVADALALRRRGYDVVRRLTLPAQPAPGEAPHELGLRDLEVHDGVERLTELLQHHREPVGLRDRAREPVEDEALRGVVAPQAL